MEIIKKLCEMKQVQLIDGNVCVDHIHMYVAIPPKMCVSEFMSYLKGKSTLMLFDRHPEYRSKYGDRHPHFKWRLLTNWMQSMNING